MTVEKAIDVLKSECYVFNPLNLDRTTLINTALDTVIEALEKKEKKSCEGCLYENTADFAEECRYCNRLGSDRYVNKEEYYDEDEEESEGKK
jgi:hypothetical protein